MEGRFLEIYNETITDLLLPPPAAGDPRVLTLLAQAQGRRRVAAMLMERSSRSHSVFTLRIHGV
ncbi:hypothetical protein B0H14DRAFT_3009291 [Mycena olivaceomarginata]|nr:hypothetical protein B0H14DRAFT_3009291 [Mycena olivaceomarginata]